MSLATPPSLGLCQSRSVSRFGSHLTCRTLSEALLLTRRHNDSTATLADVVRDAIVHYVECPQQTSLHGWRTPRARREGSEGPPNAIAHGLPSADAGVEPSWPSVSDRAPTCPTSSVWALEQYFGLRHDTVSESEAVPVDTISPVPHKCVRHHAAACPTNLSDMAGAVSDIQARKVALETRLEVAIAGESSGVRQRVRQRVRHPSSNDLRAPETLPAARRWYRGGRRGV